MSQSRREAHLARVLDRLLDGPKVDFADVISSTLPSARGLYLLVDFVEDDVLLVGSGSLRERVYQNLLQGEKSSRGKALLMELGRARTMRSAKRYLRECCLVQYLELDVDDDELQGYEDYAKAMLQPLSPG